MSEFACHQPGCQDPVVEMVAWRRQEPVPCCERHAILKRAGWRCQGTRRTPAGLRRMRPAMALTMECSVVGSEIAAFAATSSTAAPIALCPHCAAEMGAVLLQRRCDTLQPA